MARRKHRASQNLPVSTDSPTVAVLPNAWMHEHDVKEFCPHCRNYRSAKHVEEHALRVAGITTPPLMAPILSWQKRCACGAAMNRTSTRCRSCHNRLRAL